MLCRTLAAGLFASILVVSPGAAQERGSSTQPQPVRTHWAGAPGLREIPRASLERVARALHDDPADDTVLEGLLVGAGAGALVAGAFTTLVAQNWSTVIVGAAIGAGGGAMIGLVVDATL